MARKNCMDFIPVKSAALSWDTNEDGLITIHMPHKGPFHWVTQKLLFYPEQSHIALDHLSSFVWEQIDGEKTIFQIAQEVRDQFGTQAEPLYERLLSYFRILKNNHFITWSKQNLFAPGA